MAKEPTTTRRANGPRPAFLMFSKSLPDDVEVVAITRKADEALEMIDEGKAGAYKRVMIK